MIPYAPPAPATSVPLVDLSVGSGAEDRRAIAREIHKACRDSGFFYVSGHDVSQALIDAQFEWSRRFFDLDQAGKQALHMARSANHAGYEPIGAQTLDADAHKAYELLQLSHRMTGQTPGPVSAYFTFEAASTAAVDHLAARAVELGGAVVKAPYATYYNAHQAVLTDPEHNVFRVNHRMGPRASVSADRFQ